MVFIHGVARYGRAEYSLTPLAPRWDFSLFFYSARSCKKVKIRLSASPKQVMESRRLIFYILNYCLKTTPTWAFKGWYFCPVSSDLHAPVSMRVCLSRSDRMAGEQRYHGRAEYSPFIISSCCGWTCVLFDAVEFLSWSDTVVREQRLYPGRTKNSSNSALVHFLLDKMDGKCGLCRDSSENQEPVVMCMQPSVRSGSSIQACYRNPKDKK